MRPAVADHEIGGALDELAVTADAGLALQVEADLHVDAAVAEVAVVRRLVVVLVQQRPKVAQVARPACAAAPPNRPTLPTAAARRAPRSRRAGPTRESSRPPSLRPWCRRRDVRRVACSRFTRSTSRCASRVGIGRVVGAELHEQIAAALGDQVEVRRALALERRRSSRLRTLRARSA